MKIEKAEEIGLCFGVKRAIGIIEKVARERGGMETLGALAHNQQVLQRLAGMGIRIAMDIDDIQGDTVAISAHGISPQLEEQIRRRNINIIDATCPFVRRAQIAARRLAGVGFSVIVYGDADHAEVKGILGQTTGRGIATLDSAYVTRADPLPRRLGILSQTTQVPANFTGFVKKVIDAALDRDSEIRIVDTICHDTRKRQAAAVGLTGRVDLMLVVGSRTSANTNHLAELCSAITETHLIETADEIHPAWLNGKGHIGITAGASTPEESINEVLTKLKAMT